MKYVSTAAQVRELDRRAIELFGIPGVALMETAAHGVAEAIRTHHEADARKGVILVCGVGNNGGDGFAIARWLYQWGFKVGVLQLGEAKTPDAKVQREAAFRVGVPFVKQLGRPGLLVDAVFGTGLGRTVTGRAAQLLKAMADLGVPCVAVDMPSGLHSDKGIPLGPVVPAIRTVTFGRIKPGLLAGQGPELAGAVELVDIGLTAGPELSVAEIPEASDLIWPERHPSAHKGKSGHLVVVAGSERMAGAAVLTCAGALAAGAGLVTLVAPAGCAPRLGALPPEVMWVRSSEGSVTDELPAALISNASAIVAGPGLAGGGELSTALERALVSIWSSHPRPVLFDADALPCAVGPGKGPRVVTPHPGEAGRMLRLSTQDIVGDRFGAAEALASDDRTALLKGQHSLVATQGKPISVNPTNAPAMASGGSGDVLAGLVGALLGRGLSARHAARLAAFVHGRAGEIVQAGPTGGGTATELLTALPRAIQELRR